MIGGYAKKDNIQKNGKNENIPKICKIIQKN